MNGFIVVIGLDLILALPLFAMITNELIVSEITGVIALVTMCFVLWQITLAREELHEVKKQGKVLELQTQRAELEMWLTKDLDKNDLGHFQVLPLGIGNRGKRSAHGVKVDLLLPPGAEHVPPRTVAEEIAIDVEAGGWSTFTMTSNDVNRVRMLKSFDRTFYAKRGNLYVANLRLLLKTRLTENIKYCLQYDDGTTPEDGKWEELVFKTFDPITFLPRDQDSIKIPPAAK